MGTHALVNLGNLFYILLIILALWSILVTRPKWVLTKGPDTRESLTAPRQDSECRGTSLQGDVSGVRLVDHIRRHYRLLRVTIRVGYL